MIWKHKRKQTLSRVFITVTGNEPEQQQRETLRQPQRDPVSTAERPCVRSKERPCVNSKERPCINSKERPCVNCRETLRQLQRQQQRETLCQQQRFKAGPGSAHHLSSSPRAPMVEENSQKLFSDLERCHCIHSPQLARITHAHAHVTEILKMKRPQDYRCPIHSLIPTPFLSTHYTEYCPLISSRCPYVPVIPERWHLRREKGGLCTV